MILFSQDQFREDYIRPLYKGEKVELPAGYAEKFAEWKLANAQIFDKLSPEEIVKSFALYLEESIQNDLKKLIDEAKIDERNLATRGQMLLASKDGKNFDQVITPEKAKETNPEELQLLSPTLRSTTTDLNEVLNEQVLLHTVKNLTSNGFFVNSAAVENGIVNVDVKTAKGAEYKVQVDPNQSSNGPLSYTFINEKGQKSVVGESQLPEKYSEIEEKAVSEISPLGLAATGAILGLDALNKQNMMALGKGMNNRSLLPESYGAPKLNVIEAKARLEREKAGLKLVQERRQKLEEEIEVHNEKERIAKIKEKNRQAKITQKKQSGVSGKTAGAVVGATAMGAIAAPLITSIITTVIL